MKIFIDGMSARKPSENAPTWVKASIGIRRDALVAWLAHAETKNGWLNAQICESKKGSWYVELDTYAADNTKAAGPTTPAPANTFDKDVPF